MRLRTLPDKRRDEEDDEDDEESQYLPQYHSIDEYTAKPNYNT